jgi:SAM-dependent methyltransferase
VEGKTIGLNQEQSLVGDFWDKKLKEHILNPELSRSYWWKDPVTVRHINRLVCGEPLDGVNTGFHRRIVSFFAPRKKTAVKAISIGAGSGEKEMWLLETGAVETFDCYELGPGLVRTGEISSKKRGLSDRCRMILADPLSTEVPNDYDLVYWNNSLHHFFDTHEALEWSHNHLKPGGLLAFDEYVGPNRFQFSDSTLQAVSEAMAILPDKYLQHMQQPGVLAGRKIANWDAEEVAKADPSEAPDSINILPAFKDIFQDHEVIITGGVIYFLALNHVFANFKTEEDILFLQSLLLIDKFISELHETAYAVGFGVKGT